MKRSRILALAFALTALATAGPVPAPAHDAHSDSPACFDEIRSIHDSAARVTALRTFLREHPNDCRVDDARLTLLRSLEEAGAPAAEIISAVHETLEAVDGGPAPAAAVHR